MIHAPKKVPTIEGALEDIFEEYSNAPANIMTGDSLTFDIYFRQGR